MIDRRGVILQEGDWVTVKDNFLSGPISIFSPTTLVVYTGRRKLIRHPESVEKKP